MLDAAESIAAAPEAIPSLWGAALRLGVALGLLAAGATAWLYWHRRLRGPSRTLEVLERAALTRGASVAVVRVEQRRLLVGISGDGVRLIRDLGDAGSVTPAGSFTDVLAEATAAEARS